MSNKKQTTVTVTENKVEETKTPKKTYREKKNTPVTMEEYLGGEDTTNKTVANDATEKVEQETTPQTKKKSSAPKQPKKQKPVVVEEVTEDTTSTTEENVNEMVDKLVDDIIEGGAPAPIKTELDDAILNKVAEMMGYGCMNPSFVIKYAGMFFTNPEVFDGKMKKVRKDLTSLIINDVERALHENGYEPSLGKKAIKTLWGEFAREFRKGVASSIKKEVREEIITEKMKDYVKGNFTETDIYKELVGDTSSDAKLFNMLNNHVKETVTPINVEEAAERTSLLLQGNSVIDAISYEKPVRNLYNRLLDIASIKSPTNEEIEEMYRKFMVLYLSEIMNMRDVDVVVEIDKWIGLRKSNKDWFNLVSFWVLSAFDMTTDTESFLGCMTTLYPKTHNVVMCAGGVQEYLHTLAKEINFALGSGEYYTR